MLERKAKGSWAGGADGKPGWEFGGGGGRCWFDDEDGGGALNSAKRSADMMDS